MVKRIDGIYRCHHDAYIEDDVNMVLCSKCPYLPRPSQMGLDSVIRFTGEVGSMTIYADTKKDMFMVVRHNGK
jgi:hypothetical protein